MRSRIEAKAEVVNGHDAAAPVEQRQDVGRHEQHVRSVTGQGPAEADMRPEARRAHDAGPPVGGRRDQLGRLRVIEVQQVLVRATWSFGASLRTFARRSISRIRMYVQPRSNSYHRDDSLADEPYA